MCAYFLSILHLSLRSFHGLLPLLHQILWSLYLFIIMISKRKAFKRVAWRSRLVGFLVWFLVFKKSDEKSFILHIFDNWWLLYSLLDTQKKETWFSDLIGWYVDNNSWLSFLIVIEIRRKQDAASILRIFFCIENLLMNSSGCQKEEFSPPLPS